MRFISVLSIYITTIYCSSQLKEEDNWSAQLANVFFHSVGDKKFTYILVEKDGYDYRTLKPGEKDFSDGDFTEKGLKDAKEKMSEHDGDLLEPYEDLSMFCSGFPTYDQEKQTIYSFDFEPFNFMGYDHAKNPTLKCLVNIWPEKEDGITQFNNLAHVELTFVRETETTVEWRLVKMTKDPNQDVSDDEFKNFDVMIFQKAVYNKATLKNKTSKWDFVAYEGEKEESNKINNVQRIDYIGTFIITFEELKDKKVKYIDYIVSDFPAGDLNVIDFMNENKEKK